MSRETMAERQVRLEEQMRAVVSSLASLERQGHEAAESRKKGYEAAELVRFEIMGIKHRLDGLERSVEGIKPTSAEYAQVRDRVVFAGTLGRVVWNVGKAVLSFAAGMAATYYAMTGKPPP